VTELAIAMFAAATGSHLVTEPRSARFDEFRRAFDEQACRQALPAAGLRWVSRSEPLFPERLRRIHDPPVGLFVRGSAPLDVFAGPCVAVVGARACSTYGSDVATMLARELARAGVLVVSGLARGIDAAAHRGALATGRTAAVLGCGIDRDYPSAHAALAADVSATGLIVSEYAPGVEPAPWRFPARNRIVAGLCDATVVVEARVRSGALITADLALEEGREVLAVPGEITSHLSAGTNALLRLGATPVTTAADVLHAVGVSPVEASPVAPGAPLGAAAERVRAVVADAAVTFDEIVRHTALDPAVVSASLVELELLGLLREADGVYREVMPPA
jgi:DNA processing protein